jgi:hypothetical protein
MPEVIDHLQLAEIDDVRSVALRRLDEAPHPQL